MEPVNVASPASPGPSVSPHHGSSARASSGQCDSPMCALCRSTTPVLSSGGARTLRIPRRALLRPSGASSGDEHVDAANGGRVALSASRTIEAPFADETFSDRDSVESARAWPSRSSLSPSTLSPNALSAELERLELERAQGSTDRVRLAVAATQRSELERARHASLSQSTLFERAAAPALERQRNEDLDRERRRRERRRAADDAQAALERDAAQSLQVLQTLSDQSTAVRRAALLEKQKAQQLQLQQLQRQQEQLTQERQKLIEQQQQQERKQQQQQQQEQQQKQQPPPQPAAGPQAGAVSTRPAAPTASSGIWGEFKALSDAFPAEHAGKLFRLKIPITKALNQVTPEPPVAITKAKEIVATLREAAAMSPGLLRVVQFHLASQLCGIVLSKIAAKLSNVFPLAAVTAFVVHSMPEVWPLLVAGLQVRCGLLVPSFVERQPGEPEARYKARMGCDNDSTFIREQNGYVSFFAAVCAAQVSADANLRVCMPRIGELWTLLSSILNERPMFLCPDLITAILDTAGAELLAVYGRQAQKLLVYIHRVYLPMCRDPTKTRDQVVDMPLVTRLSDMMDAAARAGFRAVPEVKVDLFPDFTLNKKAFQMRPI